MPLEVYADCADLAEMEKWAPKVAGFTTNPSLARAAGVTDYLGFCREAVRIAGSKPVSLEVVNRYRVEYEAGVLADLGENVRVKIPVSEYDRWAVGIKANVTGVLSWEQVKDKPMPQVATIVSVFAGRIADTGRDPMPLVSSIRAGTMPRFIKILWASAREVYNVKQAEQAGADIITLSPALLAKLDGFGRDLDDYSAETINQFYADAEAAGLVIP